jgi:hypothetical protein
MKRRGIVTNQNYTKAAPDPKSGRNKKLAIGGGIAAVILCCCLIIAVAAFIYLDPFRWVGLFRGSDNPTAKTMPADTEMYFGFNMADVRNKDVTAVIAAFAEAGDLDFTDFDTLIQYIDEEVLYDWGMTLWDDVIPWIGNWVAVGIYNTQVDPYYGPEDADVVMVIEARNPNDADKFVTDFVDNQESEYYADMQDSEYKGVTIYYDDYSEVAITRYKDYVYIGSSQDALEEAMDALDGDSLADTQAYKDLLAVLPSRPMFSVYFEGASLQDFAYAASVSEMPGLMNQNLPLLGTAFSLAVTKEGIQLDSATQYDVPALTETQRAMLEAGRGKGALAEFFPANTYLYINGTSLDLAWQAVRDTMLDTLDAEEFDEAMQAFEDTLGFDMDSFFTLLDGDMALGMLADSGGFYAEEVGIPLGFLFFAETSDQAALQSLLDDFTDALEDDMFMQVNRETVGDYETYTLGDEWMGDMFTYGLGDSKLVFASTLNLLEDALDASASLADDSRYKDTWRAFGGGQRPAFYLVLWDMLDAMRQGMEGYDLEDFDESTKFLQPITIIAAASGSYDDGLAHTTTVIFVTTK